MVSVTIGAAAVAITAVYAYLTYRILQANRNTVAVMHDQFEATTRPYVVIDVFAYPGIPIFKLRIRNVGTSSANNLQLTVDKDFYRFNRREDHYNLRKLAAFSRPIKTFPPHAELLFDLGVSFDIYKDVSITPTEFDITASYEFSEKTVSEITHVDLDALRGTAANPEPITDELRKIRETLDKRKG